MGFLPRAARGAEAAISLDVEVHAVRGARRHDVLVDVAAAVVVSPARRTVLSRLRSQRSQAQSGYPGGVDECQGRRRHRELAGAFPDYHLRLQQSTHLLALTMYIVKTTMSGKSRHLL